MTIQQPIHDSAQPRETEGFALPTAGTLPGTIPALPVAPLAMPKQVLTQDHGVLRRLVAFGVSRLSGLIPGVRRIT